MGALRLPLACSIVIAACAGEAPPPDPGRNTATPAFSAGLPALERVSISLPESDLPIRPISTLALTSFGTVSFRPDSRREPVISTVDSTGQVVARWGVFGEGPGEMRGDEFLLSSDSAVVLAGSGGEPVRVYHPHGRLIKQRSGPPTGVPTAMAGGALAWWTGFARGAGPRSEFRVGRRGSVNRWCALTDCIEELLPAADPIVASVDSAAPPPGAGGWPPATLTQDAYYVGDGYDYVIWRIALNDLARRTRISRQVPPRMVTEREFAEADSAWSKTEREGVPGPNGQRIRENFDREREFLRTQPRPHFQMFGLSVDGRGRLWVIGKANDSTFLDVFADTTFLGRHMLDCDRTGYAGAVRGSWLALGCEERTGDFPYQLRLYRIVEPDSARVP